MAAAGFRAAPGVCGPGAFACQLGNRASLEASQPEAEALPDYARHPAQLRLKLEPQTRTPDGPVEIIVVDHAEKTPAAN
jgi:hypothetical protein